MSSFNLIKAEVPQRKVFFLDGNGKLDKDKFTFAKYYTCQNIAVSNLKDMHDWFGKVFKHKDVSKFSVIRGDWRQDEELWFADEMRIFRLEEAGKAGKQLPKSELDAYLKVREKDGRVERLRRGALMVDAPRNWVCFDFDGFMVEGLGDFDVANPEPWVKAAIASELGPEFENADHIIHLSSSAGVSEGLRAHIWFWLDTPMDGAAWRAWYGARVKALGRKPEIDKTLFEKEKIHFIAPPLFRGSAEDPCAVSGRHIYVEGEKASVSLQDIDFFLIESDVAREKREAKGIDYLADEDRDEAKSAWTQWGVEGAFNRVFSMSETINRFLSKHFEIETSDGRVSWHKEGVEKTNDQGCKIIACNTKMISSHKTCPFNNEPRNAFEHVTHYLFGGDDLSAKRWAMSIPEVREEKDREELSVFDDAEPSPRFIEQILLDGESVPEPEVVMTPELMMKEYPFIKNFDGSPGRYALNADGEWFYGYDKEAEEDDLDEKASKKKNSKKKPKSLFIELWSPITILSQDACLETGSVSARFKLRGLGGRSFEVSVRRSDLEPIKLAAILKDKGWLHGKQKHIDFCDICNRRMGKMVSHVVQSRGWNLPPEDSVRWNGMIFATPSGGIIGSDKWNTDDTFRLRKEIVLSDRVKSSGTLEGWKEALRQIMAVDNVPHWVLGPICGLAGPLVEVLSAPNTGFAITGFTSRGKTSMMRFAGSVWATPDEKKGGLLKTLSSTFNAVESTAVAANGTVLLLDETNLMDANSLEKMIYTLSTGITKMRLDKDGNARPVSRWSTFGLISGEMGLAEKFETASNNTRKMGKGAGLRYLDMDVSGFNDKVPSETISAIYAYFLANFGVAGPEFVRRLIEDRWLNRVDELAAIRREYTNKLTDGDQSGVLTRGADVLSLVWLAAYLADKWSITPEGYFEAVESAISVFWNQFRNSAVVKSDASVIDSIRSWVNAKWGRGIIDVTMGDASGARDIEAWYNDEYIFVPVRNLTAAAGNVVREREIVRTLKGDGLISFEDKRYTFKYVPNVGEEKHYRLLRNAPNGFRRITDNQEGNVNYEF